LSCGQMTFFYN